ncbi:hypothetical protein GCM10010185_30750 [Saccharothrix coeruleofusca]|uniref:Uncharacterized protein n=1 Tax=Saccharothrix coeruleofusca TaxID=33919 RepID=A0A918ALB1_9PSEU|nr:hypothetical protein GCM10010185_30750 [Saccharothrix coeruleofusca]
MALEGTWSAPSMQTVLPSTNNLKQAAESGSFTLSECGFWAYIEAAQFDLAGLDSKLLSFGRRRNCARTPMVGR